jgi:hypothetical protein
MPMADNFNKLVRLRLRGGTVNEWSSSSDVKLLEGEFAYQVNRENNEYPITLHKGDGAKTWEQLTSVDPTNNMEPFTFFSGRGAGLFKATQRQMSEDGSLILSEEVFGKVTIKEDEQNIKLRDGYLSLADDEGKVFLKADSVTSNSASIKKLEVKEALDINNATIYGNWTVTGDRLVLRPEATVGLVEDVYSGVVITRYNDNADRDIGLLLNNEGVWQFASRSHTTQEIDEVDDEGNPTGNKLTIENIGDWEEFTPISTIQVEANYSGPVRYENNRLESWQPKSLSIVVNSGEEEGSSIFYDPNGMQDASLSIKTLNKITITPRSYEDGEELVEQDYTVDDNGELKIELPIPTNESINTWNAKVGGITLGTVPLTVDSNYNVTIPVDDSLINNGVLTPPIKTIIYDEITQIPEDGTVWIEAVRPVLSGDNVNIEVRETDKDNFTISHKSAEVDATSNISTDFLTGDHRFPESEGFKIKVVSNIEYDAAGHITKIETATYDLATLRSLLYPTS